MISAVKLVHGWLDAAGEQQFEALHVRVEFLVNDELLFGSKFSEDEVRHVHLRRLLGADADPVTNEAVADVGQEARDAIVPAGAAVGGHLQEAKIDREIVVHGHKLGDVQFVVPEHRADRPAAVVHERLRLEQRHRLAERRAGREVRLPLAARPAESPAPGQLVGDPKADVVPRRGVLRAGISQPDDEP